MKQLASKIHNLVFGKRCEVRPGIKYLSIDEFLNLKKTPFSFKNHNNITLNGYLYALNGVKNTKTIILCHGMFGGHEAYMQEINYFCNNGFNVISFDYQGTILSEGESIDGLLQGLEDVDSFLTLLEENNYLNDDFYLFGHSWGAFIATANLKFHPSIKKVVACSGFVSLPIIFKDMLPFPLCFLNKSLTNLEETKHPKYKNISTLDVLNNTSSKVLLIHSIDDNTVRFKSNFKYLEKHIKNSNIHFKKVNDKKHNVTYKIESVDALNDYLKSLNKVKSTEEAILLANNTDFKKLSDLDSSMMEEIISFFNK